MKNFCIIFLSSFIIILTAVCGISFDGGQVQTNENGYLRIHIRANSNLESDQAVKYLVRDAIVEYLTPVVANCSSKDSAKAKMQEHLEKISSVAQTVLQENGYEYSANAVLKKEQFPTRVYGEYTLQSGVYDALIVELGQADGDNWWCVVYPPLCFAGGNLTAENIVYKSKIAEIIKKWKTDGAGTD